MEQVRAFRIFRSALSYIRINVILKKSIKFSHFGNSMYRGDENEK